MQNHLLTLPHERKNESGKFQSSINFSWGQIVNGWSFEDCVVPGAKLNSIVVTRTWTCNMYISSHGCVSIKLYQSACDDISCDKAGVFLISLDKI